MKKACLLIAVLWWFTIHLNAQKIQYSRQTFKMPYADAMQVVANVGGYHHVICFNANKYPVIYSFDAQLQLKEKHAIENKLKENSDIRIIPFKDFYFLYVHILGTSTHELFRIDGEGNITTLSGAFQKFIEQSLNKTTSTLQLFNQQEKLFAVTHTYYDGIKKIGSNVFELDSKLNPVTGRKVLYNFNRAEDVLQQSMLIGNSLLVLKTSRNDEKGNSLDVIKIDLSTGQSLINSFNSGSHLYTSPSISYLATDSTVLVYSSIREPIGSGRSERTVFLSRLNHLLEETTPVSLLRSQFRGNTVANYLLLQKPSCWLDMSNSIRVRTNPRTPASQNFEMQNDPSMLSFARRSPISSTYFAEYNQPTAIRLTMLNENFEKINDSLVANDKKIFEVQPKPFAQFTISNKAYLLLIQNFSSKHRGILMVSMDKNETLTTTDIPVFDKYEYLLQLLQVVNNEYVILPYTHKSDVGLLKLSFH